jgi:hypothetical protein
MRALLNLIAIVLRCTIALLRSRREQAIVELALRQQLSIYANKESRPPITPLDRSFWIALAWLWPRWKEVLVFVKPQTVISWHRKGFRIYWRAISKRGPGRPRISKESQDLIRLTANQTTGEPERSKQSLQNLAWP